MCGTAGLLTPPPHPPLVRALRPAGKAAQAAPRRPPPAGFARGPGAPHGRSTTGKPMPKTSGVAPAGPAATAADTPAARPEPADGPEDCRADRRVVAAHEAGHAIAELESGWVFGRVGRYDPRGA